MGGTCRLYECISDVSEVKFRGSAEAVEEAKVSLSKNADADVVAEVMESLFAEAEVEPFFFKPFTVWVLRRQ